MALLQHPNLLQLVGIVTTRPVLLLTAFMPHGDLREYLRKCRQPVDKGGPEVIGLAQVKSMVLQVVDALAYLSSVSIIHRDIAARNVLVSDRGSECIKLADFGLSRSLAGSDVSESTPH